MKYAKKYYPILLIIIGLLVAIITIILVAINNFNPLDIDENVRDYFYNIRGEKYGFCYWLFRILTEFGFVYAIIVIVILCAFLFKSDIRLAIVSLGSLFVWAFNSIIKLFFNRERPYEIYRWANESSSSLPSGHSMTSTFLYLTLIYYILKSKLKTKFKIILSILLGIILIVVMISRLVLGVHYFTDVLSGFGLGLFCFGVGILLDRLFTKHNFKYIRGVIDRKKETKNIA